MLLVDNVSLCQTSSPANWTVSNYSQAQSAFSDNSSFSEINSQFIDNCAPVGIDTFNITNLEFKDKMFNNDVLGRSYLNVSACFVKSRLC